MPTEREKLFAFAPKHTTELIGLLLQDEAAVTKRSQSAITENALLSFLLPNDVNLADIVGFMYLGVSTLGEAYSHTIIYLMGFEGFHCSESMAELFQSISSFLGKEAMEKFCANRSAETIFYDGSEDFYLYLQELFARLKFGAERDNNHEIANACEEIIDRMKEHPNEFSPFGIWEWLCEHWDTICSYDPPYCLIRHLLCHHPEIFESTEKTRYEFVQCLKRIEQDLSSQ